MPRRTARMVPVLVVALLAAGCSMRRARGDAPRWELNGRPARELPTLFLTDTTASRPGGDRAACPARLVDPRDGTRLELERAQPVGANTAAATGANPDLPTSAPASGRDRTPRPTPSPARELRGDYRVASGRYGVAAGERLRIDCLTQRVVGIVGAAAP